MTDDQQDALPAQQRIDNARAQAYEAVVEGMREAALRGDLESFDHLADRILNDPQTSSPVDLANRRRRRTRALDVSRIVLTFILVLALAAIIFYVIWASKDPAGDSAAAAPYVSIFSGLVGIAVGWLFGTSTRAADVEPTSRSVVVPVQLRSSDSGATASTARSNAGNAGDEKLTSTTS